MRGITQPVIHHRIKGPAALLRSARSLQLRLHRFGLGRARTPGEIRWTAKALDAIDLVVKVMEQPAVDERLVTQPQVKDTLDLPDRMTGNDGSIVSTTTSEAQS